MLDFVISKVAMIMAAVFILIAALGFYSIQRDALEDEELQNIANEISQSVNEVNSLSANVVTNITFNRFTEGLYLKPFVGGKPYEVRITRNIVFIKQSGRSASSSFLRPVHVWDPDLFKGNYSEGELSPFDSNLSDFVISSNGNNVIFIERMETDNGNFETFVYPHLGRIEIDPDMLTDKEPTDITVKVYDVNNNLMDGVQVGLLGLSDYKNTVSFDRYKGNLTGITGSDNNQKGTYKFRRVTAELENDRREGTIFVYVITDDKAAKSYDYSVITVMPE